MEYPELHEDEVSRLKRDTDSRDLSKTKLAEGRKILKQHNKVAENKAYEYALSQAYLDCDEDDTEEDKEDGLLIAHGIWQEAKIGHTMDLIEKKADQIRKRIKWIEELRKRINRTRGLIRAIGNFRPNQKQAKRKVVQDEFVFAPGSKWLEWTKERRRMQERRYNSRFKTFVDIFSRPNYRIFPKQEGKFGQRDFDHLPLDPVVVDPEKISDSFLTTLECRKHGIHPVSGKHQIDRLRAKEKMIPAVKRFFERHVSPLNRAGWDDEDVNWRLLVIKGYSPYHDGKIIHPRFDTSKDPDERNKVMTVYGSAYSARRNSSRLYGEYEKESDLLYRIKWHLELVRKELMSVKKGDSNESNVLKESKKKLKKLLEYLGNPKDSKNPRKPDNVYKSSAYERLLTTAELKDIRGRINKGASLSKLVVICDDLQDRLEEVDDTSIAGPENQNTLNSEINQSENVLESYGDAFQACIDTGEESRGKFEALNGTLDKVRVRPFNLYARRLQVCIKKMKAESDPDVKTDLARRGLAITNLFKIQKHVEWLIAKNDKIPTEVTEVLYIHLDQLAELADQHRVHDCEGVFELFRDRLTELKEEIKDAMKQQYAMSPYNSKTMLKAIDFGAILKKAG
jgi:hypothetical protein